MAGAAAYWRHTTWKPPQCCLCKSEGVHVLALDIERCSTAAQAQRQRVGGGTRSALAIDGSAYCCCSSWACIFEAMLICPGSQALCLFAECHSSCILPGVPGRRRRRPPTRRLPLTEQSGMLHVYSQIAWGRSGALWDSNLTCPAAFGPQHVGPPPQRVNKRRP